MQTAPLITHIRTMGWDTTSLPTVLLIETETENGPLVLKATITAAHELAAHLRRLPLSNHSPSGIEP